MASSTSSRAPVFIPHITFHRTLLNHSIGGMTAALHMILDVGVEHPDLLSVQAPALRGHDTRGRGIMGPLAHSRGARQHRIRGQTLPKPSVHTLSGDPLFISCSSPPPNPLLSILPFIARRSPPCPRPDFTDEVPQVGPRWNDKYLLLVNFSAVRKSCRGSIFCRQPFC